MSVLVGTSGYNYEAWRGSFYPEDLPAKRMLSHYAQQFDSVEINYSFYRKPTAKLLQGWAAQVPERFRFALKAWQRITHQKRLRDCAELVSDFADAARTLGPKLGPVLYQLPPNLKADLPLLRDFLNQRFHIAVRVRDVREGLGYRIYQVQKPKNRHLVDLRPVAEMPPAQRVNEVLVVTPPELRHETWFNEETYAALREAGAALCVAESEDLATPPVRTASFGYFRLRRLDYDESALRKWAEIVKELPGEVFAYFKHEDEARGPAFAKAFIPLVNSSDLG